MKYQSELIKEMVDSRGHEKSSTHYQSECVETWIEEAKGGYPKLCDYESEWLNYIVQNPIGEFPYETVSTNTTATVNNVVPYAYKSAILKGNTKYRDIGTGDILDTFDETKNLELVSVKMPVLTTANLLKVLGNEEIVNIYNSMGYANVAAELSENGKFVLTKNGGWNSPNKVWRLEPNTTYTARIQGEVSFVGFFPNAISNVKRGSFNGGIYVKFTTDAAGDFGFLLNFTTGVEVDFNVFYGDVTSKLTEPYKSNILTVNEGVTLRSNGSVYDELDCLTGKLTQCIDEDGEILTQEVVKTVELTVTDQDGNTLSTIKPIEGMMYIEVSGSPVAPTAVLEVPVEAVTQNLASFIEEE